MRTSKELNGQMNDHDQLNLEHSDLSLSMLSEKAYHEMADQPVVQTDLMSLVEGNLNLLEDLQMRVTFMMKEVRCLLKVEDKL